MLKKTWSSRNAGRTLTLVPDYRSVLKFDADKTYVVGPTAKEKRTIVTFSGEMDFTTATAVRRVLDNVCAPAVLDFGGVRFIDASILTELTKFAKRIAPFQAVITGLQPSVRRVFEIAEFGRVLAIDGMRLHVVRAMTDEADLDPAG